MRAAPRQGAGKRMEQHLMAGPYTIEGIELEAIKAAIAEIPKGSALFVWCDEGGVKFKIGGGTWSPAFGH